MWPTGPESSGRRPAIPWMPSTQAGRDGRDRRSRTNGDRRARMLNSADCGTKTAHAGVGVPSCEKPSRDKGLMQGRSRLHRRVHGTSRYVTEKHTAALSRGRQASASGIHEAPNIAMVGTTLATDISELNYSRLRCHGQRSEPHLALGWKNQLGLELTGAAALDRQLPMRQDGRELLVSPSVTVKGHIQAGYWLPSAFNDSRW